MLKWILGCLGLAVVVVCFAAWYGYKKLQTLAKEGPSAIVTIQAPASRVFASLADADSMTEWRTEGLGIRSSRQGRLQVGDTLLAQGRSRGTTSNQRSRVMWVVTAVIPDTVVGFEARNDSTGMSIFIRRDSVVALGDSTRVVSTFAAPILDSLRRRGDTSGMARNAMINLASNAMVTGMRVMSEQELKRLKGRIEGRPVRDSVPRPR